MVWRVVLTFIFVTLSFSLALFDHTAKADDSSRLMTVYDRGTTRLFLTNETTIEGALKAEGIDVDAHDAVEPSLKQQLVASNYKVNIYRARPVVVVDGAVRIKTVSAYQTAAQIAKDVGIVINDEDTTMLRPLNNFVNDGAGLELTIRRATTITLDLYGKKTVVRTQARTVNELLQEKNITLGAEDNLSLSKESVIYQGIEVRIWREGKQTIAIDQDIPVSSRIVYDADQPIGYRTVQAKGVPGIRSVTYEIEVKGGVETSRIEIASIITRQPTEQTEVIGLKNNGSGLTKSRGAQVWTDSKGVSHRETYYDLNMRVVMQSCGQGGYYSVRPDGAKVDAQGYILIAASYGRYPKCSLVETSLGMGKVYDTGGFATRYPDGFDLATDWSSEDGI